MFRLPLRSDLTLALTCLGLYVATAAQVRSGSKSALEVGYTAISQPLVRLVDQVIALVKDAGVGRQDWQATLAELARIRSELEALRRDNQLLASELATLRQADQLLDSLPSLRAQGVLALVTARDILGTHTLVLNKGRAHGLRKDCAVLAAEGVLGRVDQVWEARARVQLLSHPAAAAAAQVVGVGGEVLLMGGEHPRLEGYPPYTQVPSGSPVVTTGSEGIYPAGLTLGVTGEGQLGALFTVVPVVLSARPERTRVVLVLCQEIL